MSARNPAAPGATQAPTPARAAIQSPFYPVVYVRGYAMLPSEREETFHDAYYGFAATSVEKREAPPPKYFEPDVFEGQLIRLMKAHGYVDAANDGLERASDPARSLWVCRFYDQDFFQGKTRPIEEHAEDLRQVTCVQIPKRLAELGVPLGPDNRDFKFILIAHSMGGLVCRTLIQNLLPACSEDPKRWIHRLVTLGSPHRGIELGNIPAFLQNFLQQTFDPFDSKMFLPTEIRRYLKLPDDYEPHSLGDPDATDAYPVGRCLCLVGSDYQSYTLAKAATGSVSDGLVKQANAYIVTGKKPAVGDYPDDRRAFWANVHRAHSGYRGIVNSYESYENLQRFLFGDVKAVLSLENGQVLTDRPDGFAYMYDVEFALTVRNTGVYLHRRQQDPCENAIRLTAPLPPRILLHTAFLNSRLRSPGALFSHFLVRLRIVERRIKDGLLWDHEYPDRPIYSESIEIRIGDETAAGGQHPLGYRWLSEAAEFQDAALDQGRYTIPLRSAESFNGALVIAPSRWPDRDLTRDDA